MIKHKENGYLAKAYNVDDLAEGVRYCVSNRDMSSIARKYVE